MNVDLVIAAQQGDQQAFASLARGCGSSARKPFCDNTHLKIGFQAPGEPVKVRLSSVRPRATQPMETADDPRQG